MIFTFIINGILMIIGSLLAGFGVVSLLPFGQASTVVTYIAYTFSFAQVFWPIQLILNCMLLYIPLRLVLIPVRFVLGSRMPLVYEE